ncbi:ROK family protein [Paenibacillus terreus]|uniref:ROK family protein n=1 Tax=Paenibacillus terreus TaxID=1387834 RepID=A0ABV5B7K4_9BACL
MKKHDNGFIKKQNKKWVLDIVKSRRPISRAEIAKITDMSATSISRIVQDLENEGFLRETELLSGGVGRKANLLDIREDALYTIGVDLSEGMCRIGIMDFTDNVFYMEKVSMELAQAPEETLRFIAEAVNRTIREQDLKPDKIAGIGLGLPGIVNHSSGVVNHSVQLGWSEIHAAGILERLTGYPVIVDNDLKMLAKAEYRYGAAQYSKSSVLLGFGSGVGVAIIMNGEFYRGENNLAGEISHVTVDINGEQCKCGKIGCLGTIVTEKAMIRQAARFVPITSVHELIGHYNKQELWALNLLDRVAVYIAVTITNCLYLYNPEILVLSGPILEDYPEIRKLVEEKYKLTVSEPIPMQMAFKYAQLGDKAIVMGAALQAQDTLFNFDSL